jgi:hypothetical protein
MPTISSFDGLQTELRSQYTVNNDILNQIKPVFGKGSGFTLSQENDFDTGRTTVIVRCKFESVDFGTIEAGFQNLVGAESWRNVFPEELRTTLKTISIKEAGVGITWDGSSINLGFFDVHLGFTLGSWSPLAAHRQVVAPIDGHSALCQRSH